LLVLVLPDGKSLTAFDAHDAIGVSSHSALEELVIVWIAAASNPH
jgi:hypothetical protein